MISFCFFSRRVNLNNKVLRKVNKKIEVKNKKTYLRKEKEPRRMKKSLFTYHIGENWELLLRQADQDNGKNKGKYINLYQKFCHLFKNRLWKHHSNTDGEVLRAGI